MDITFSVLHKEVSPIDIDKGIYIIPTFSAGYENHHNQSNQKYSKPFHCRIAE